MKVKSEAKYIGCLCEYCENIQLKLDAINYHQPGAFKDLYALAQRSVRSRTKICTLSHKDLYALAQRSVRSRTKICTLSHKAQCAEKHLMQSLIIPRASPEIVQNAIDSRFQTLVANTDKEAVGNCNNNVLHKADNDCEKRSLVAKSGTVANLVNELKDEAHPFAEHLFNKDWRHAQQTKLKAKLGANEALAIFDFAENFKCGYQREVQSAYYSHESATVHPVVINYICNTCLKPVTESCVMVSNDLTHDHNLVHTAANHLQNTRGFTLSTFYRFSNGCVSQYKSKGPISDVSYAREDFGFDIIHSYSGTRYGKGASDGERGIVKKHETEAIKAGTVVINTAESLCQYFKENLTKDATGKCCIPFTRSVFYISYDDVCRQRNRATKTVKGTRKLHSIKTVKGGVVATRNLSCFCDACIHRSFHGCENKLYVHPWKEVQLCAGKF